MTKTYKEPNPDECLFDNENFLCLEEIAEEELPLGENEINQNINNDFFYETFNAYFKQIYKNSRDFEIAKKYYGIGQENRNVPELAEEYSLTNKRIRDIVSKPVSPFYKNPTKQAFNLLDSSDLIQALRFEHNPRLFLLQSCIENLAKERGLNLKEL
ncbi:MAG: hypothetical protein NTZ83_01980 [Candidatus Pacearchaeota archaeon]|nr:hypothetical protein [Candidatus Pacearchaeota archaeon]